MKRCSIVRNGNMYLAGNWNITDSIGLVIKEAKKELFDELERRIDFNGDTKVGWYKSDIEKMKRKHL